MTEKEKAYQLQCIVGAINRIAQDRVLIKESLATIYPTGTRVRVKLNCTQVVLTLATVTGVGFEPGYVDVKIDSAKSRSRQSVRRIHYTDIREVA